MTAVKVCYYNTDELGRIIQLINEAIAGGTSEIGQKELVSLKNKSTGYLDKRYSLS
jgi:hypothetical protein